MTESCGKDLENEYEVSKGKNAFRYCKSEISKNISCVKKRKIKQYNYISWEERTANLFYLDLLYLGKLSNWDK